MAQVIYPREGREIVGTSGSAVETTAKTVGKAYIDTKRQEGINRARACHRGDESACAAVKLSKDQVNEIEAKIDEMREKTTSTAEDLTRCRRNGKVGRTRYI